MATPNTHALRAIQRHLDSTADQDQQQEQSIEQNIERLRDAMRQREQEAEEQAQRALAAQRREEQARQVAEQAKVLAESAQLREQQVLKILEEIKTQMQNRPARIEPAADDEIAKSDGNSSTDAPLDSMTEKPSVPRAVTEGAIDQRALADNLFGAGEYKLATEVYQELLGGNPSEHEAVWFRYQVATGYRHLKNPERAATYYREVAAAEGHEFLAENAKWWLNVLESSASNEQRLGELTMVMEQLRNATQALK